MMRPSRHHAPAVAIVRVGDERHLTAVDAVAPGALLFEVEGEERTEPNQWSLQVGPNTHIVVPDEVDLEAEMDRYPWRFLNHSCDPNTRIVGRQVFAARAISPGDELTFDYNTTEADMAVPFECRCGSARCRGVIRGFRHQGEDARDARRSASG